MPVDDSSSGAVSAGGGISTVRLGDVAQLRPGLLTLPLPFVALFCASPRLGRQRPGRFQGRSPRSLARSTIATARICDPLGV